MGKHSQKNLSAEAAFDLLVAEEELILEAQMLIQRSLNDRNMTQKDLANLLGVGSPQISQMLGVSGRNLTLRSIARAMHALGLRVEVRLRSDEASSDAPVVEPEHRSAKPEEAQVRTARAAAALNSEAWGKLVPLPPRKPSRRRTREDAGAYAAYDPTYLKAA